MCNSMFYTADPQIKC